MSEGFSALERTILKGKGLSDEQIAEFVAVGIGSRTDFTTVGDTQTLQEVMPALSFEVADKVMAWALGRAEFNAAAATVGAAAGAAVLPAGMVGHGGKIVLDTSDAVYCVSCQAKQPKDYSSGDLCVSCGRQAEPTEACYWCASSGPGKFCRSCGATFVPTAELELAIMLRRDGIAKDDIPKKLIDMSADDKNALWGRVRHARG